MYKLFYSPGACSRAVHVALHEVGAEHTAEKVNLSDRSTLSEEFKRHNPRGKVPVLVQDGQAIREGAAILIHLLDEHKSPLLPQSGMARAQALEWLMFANATLHPAYSVVFAMMFGGMPKTDESFAAAIQHINTLWKDVEARLDQSKYLAGDAITIADILTVVIVGWNARIPGIVTGPNVARLVKEVEARPAFRKTVEAEEDQKAAA